MSRLCCTSALMGSVVLSALAPSAAPAAVINQSASLPLTTLNFGTRGAAPGVGNPLVFQQFDTQGGTRHLDSVDLTLHATIQNDFSMRFVTAGTITASVATGDPNTPGPKVTVLRPDGATPMLTLQAQNDNAALTKTITYGAQPGQTLPQEFSSNLPPSSPFYLAPAMSQQASAMSLTTPAELALFTGTGTVALPVAATALAQITSSSGNGQGSVTTQGTADLTVTYNYHGVVTSQQVPEPATVLSWGLATGAVLLLARGRRAGQARIEGSSR